MRILSAVFLLCIYKSPRSFLYFGLQKIIKKPWNTQYLFNPTEDINIIRMLSETALTAQKQGNYTKIFFITQSSFIT